jgi:glutaredoxin 3
LNITIYTKTNCPGCASAKQLLNSKNLPFVELDAEKPYELTQLLLRFPEARQMPQIFIDGQRVGGFAGLQAALRQLGL